MDFTKKDSYVNTKNEKFYFPYVIARHAQLRPKQSLRLLRFARNDAELSLPNAELFENHVQEIFRINLTDKFFERIQRLLQIKRHKFERLAF